MHRGLRRSRGHGFRIGMCARWGTERKLPDSIMAPGSTRYCEPRPSVPSVRPAATRGRSPGSPLHDSSNPRVSMRSRISLSISFRIAVCVSLIKRVVNCSAHTLNHKSCKWWLLEKRGIIAKSCKKNGLKSVEKPEFLIRKSCKLTGDTKPSLEKPGAVFQGAAPYFFIYKELRSGLPESAYHLETISNLGIRRFQDLFRQLPYSLGHFSHPYGEHINFRFIV